MLREVIINTVGTGLYPERDDKIIEIVCIELINKKRTNKIFHKYINPNRKISTDYVEFTKLNDDFLKDKPSFKEISSQLLGFIGDCQIIGHNIEQDLCFINNELVAIGLDNIKNKTIDTLKIAKELFPSKPNNIISLAKRLGIEVYGDSLIAKTEALVDIYSKLI